MEWQRIDEEMAGFHRMGCEKATNGRLIMAPRPSWGPDAVPIWRPRVDGDRPPVCTCHFDERLEAALLTVSRHSQAGNSTNDWWHQPGAPCPAPERERA